MLITASTAAAKISNCFVFMDFLPTLPTL
jgi:hypothetical protein